MNNIALEIDFFSLCFSNEQSAGIFRHDFFGSK